jgi:hypothetical protein
MPLSENATHRKCHSVKMPLITNATQCILSEKATQHKCHLAQITLSITTLFHYAECPVLFSVDIPNAIMLIVVAPMCVIDRKRINERNKGRGQKERRIGIEGKRDRQIKV